jgi:LacI family transcriptional regulator
MSMDKGKKPTSDHLKRPRLTMAQIAEKVGVSRAAVSAVLNPNYKTIKVSPETRSRIQSVIDKLQYFPNAAGQSLRYNRTGHIGFILSDNIMDGWANAYFAQILNGVETVCQQRGFGLNISRYNLSNIDSFVFPKGVAQRSIDGLVLVSGPIEAEVIARFQEFDIPCVCVGDDLEILNLIPTISSDIVSVLYQAVTYAENLGYNRIAYCFHPTKCGIEKANQLVARNKANRTSKHCQVSLLKTPGKADYTAGQPLVEEWLSMPESVRPNCLIGNDQVMVAVLKELSRHGIRCPQDIGLISTVNSNLCEFSNPGLTSLHTDLSKMGEEAAMLLLDHLEKGVPLSPQMSRNDFSSNVVARESCVGVS